MQQQVECPHAAHNAEIARLEEERESWRMAEIRLRRAYTTLDAEYRSMINEKRAALAERDLARADAEILRDVLAEAEALIRDLALGADQQSQSHADVLAKIEAYDAAVLAFMPEFTSEERTALVARGMAIVRRLMEKQDATH